MRLRLLTITIVAMMLLGNASAEGDDPPEAFSVLHNATISCSVAAPTWVLGCYIERPVLVLGSFEVAVGVDAQAAIGGESHLAPYGILAWYAPTWSAWLEVALPGDTIPVIGRPNVARFGFTYRFQ